MIAATFWANKTIRTWDTWVGTELDRPLGREILPRIPSNEKPMSTGVSLQWSCRRGPVAGRRHRHRSSDRCGPPFRSAKWPTLDLDLHYGVFVGLNLGWASDWNFAIQRLPDLLIRNRDAAKPTRLDAALAPVSVCSGAQDSDDSSACVALQQDWIDVQNNVHHQEVQHEFEAARRKCVCGCGEGRQKHQQMPALAGASLSSKSLNRFASAHAAVPRHRSACGDIVPGSDDNASHRAASPPAGLGHSTVWRLFVQMTVSGAKRVSCY
jgi:hypothetical protein